MIILLRGPRVPQKGSVLQFGRTNGKIHSVPSTLGCERVKAGQWGVSMDREMCSCCGYAGRKKYSSQAMVIK